MKLVPKQNEEAMKRHTYRDEPFQRRIIALALREPRFVEHYGDMLKPSYFDVSAYQHLAQIIVTFVTRHKRLPSKETFESLIDSYTETNGLSRLNKELLLDALNKVVDVDLEDCSWVKDEATHFAQRQEMREAIIDCRDLLDNPENHHKIVKRVQKALTVGAPRSLGISFNESALSLPSRLREGSMFDESRRVKTGIPQLDHAMMGGLGPGEIGVVLAPTGRGKSMALVSFGANAIRMGLTVFHYTLELHEDDILLRYAGNITGIPMRDIIDGSDEYARRIAPWVQKPQTALIKYFSPKSIKASGLRSHVSHTISQKELTPQLIIVDYADKLDTGSKSFNSAERSAQLGDLYDELISMGADFGAGVWTASQVGKDAWDDNVIKKSSVSASVEKMNNADVVLSLCQTEEEAALNKVRLSAEKIRRGEDNQIFRCVLDKAVARLYPDPDGDNVSQPVIRAKRGPLEHVTEDLEEKLRAGIARLGS